MMLSTNILIFVCLVAARTLAKEDILCTCASEDAGACLTPDACRCEDFHKCHITMEAAFMTGGCLGFDCWCNDNPSCGQSVYENDNQTISGVTWLGEYKAFEGTSNFCTRAGCNSDLGYARNPHFSCGGRSCGPAATQSKIEGIRIGRCAWSSLDQGRTVDVDSRESFEPTCQIASLKNPLVGCYGSGCWGNEDEEGFVTVKGTSPGNHVTGGQPGVSCTIAPTSEVGGCTCNDVNCSSEVVDDTVSSPTDSCLPSVINNESERQCGCGGEEKIGKCVCDAAGCDCQDREDASSICWSTKEKNV
eukprot:GHVN01024967.1.p1 GENE.GHVN01024967.1~~GHVN01024967.1.p1  ORF type:complete len:304 (+),score=36.35 GHVN01024967.1:74-985(+)